MHDNPSPNKKLRVGIVFGGKSAEHEVSVQSARNVLEALDRDKFEPVLIGIDKQGRWHLDNPTALHLQNGGAVPAERDAAAALTLLPGSTDRRLISSSQDPAEALDVIFPVLHGPMGEDGTIQGFLELANVPYVGPGVLSSAVGMDKDVSKRLLQGAGIPVAQFMVIHTGERTALDTAAVFRRLGSPVFVKPANLGSSVGVSKAADAATLLKAVDEAFAFDRKIILESAVTGDEVECAVLGNGEPRASVPGRIIPSAEFYTYEAKYLDEHGAELEIPAQLTPELTRRVQDTALDAYRALECEGMARVDMFVTPEGQVLVNEINTIPGFTKISMYPKLWEASGVSYKELITELIRLAIERFDGRQELRTTYAAEESPGNRLK